MVSVWSMVGMFFTMLVPLATFVGVLIWFLLHHKTGVKPFLIGAGVFLIFVLLLEGLLNRFLLNWEGVTADFFKNPWALVHRSQDFEINCNTLPFLIDSI